MSSELPSISQRLRSFSLSIGQLTFGSFLLVLAVIVITSIASVIAIRHIDATFAELQRLQSVGDLAEDIDRRMNELRLAARDFVTDPGTQVQPGRGGRRVAERDPEEDPARARARAAGHDRRRHRAAVDLPQRHRTDFGADQSPRRTDRRAAAAARAVRRGDRRKPGPDDRLDPVPDPEPDRLGAAGAQSVGRRTGGAEHAGADDRRSQTAHAPSTITPTRSLRYRSANARSPISTRRCSAPRAA